MCGPLTHQLLRGDGPCRAQSFLGLPPGLSSSTWPWGACSLPLALVSPYPQDEGWVRRSEASPKSRSADLPVVGGDRTWDTPAVLPPCWEALSTPCPWAALTAKPPGGVLTHHDLCCVGWRSSASRRAGILPSGGPLGCVVLPVFCTADEATLTSRQEPRVIWQ